MVSGLWYPTGFYKVSMQFLSGSKLMSKWFRRGSPWASRFLLVRRGLCVVSKRVRSVSNVVLVWHLSGYSESSMVSKWALNGSDVIAHGFSVVSKCVQCVYTWLVSGFNNDLE